MISSQALTDFCKAEKLPPYRIKQILEAVYGQGVESLNSITTLPLGIRKTLSEKFSLTTVTPITQETSRDKSTTKVLFQLQDGSKVEAVLMRFEDGRKTVCVSSEVGCPLKCVFCASGTLRYKRELTGEEIVDQIMYFARMLRRKGDDVNHVVYMGIGEPFRNYENFMNSLTILMDPQYLGLGARKITVSTAGIAEKIRTFADEGLQVNLALSLHAPTQELRERIMPIAHRYKLEELMDSVRYYLTKTNRRISFEYVMLNGINDSEQCARQLVDLIHGRLGALGALKKLCHVNLIPYNATDIPGIIGSPRKQIRKFQRILLEHAIPATIRVSLGQDIAAACGQLANKSEHSS